MKNQFLATDDKYLKKNTEILLIIIKVFEDLWKDGKCVQISY